MDLGGKREWGTLLLGDLALLFSSLWLTLLVRSGALPLREAFANHLAPLAIIWGIWILIFFIAGLYEKHTLILRSRLPQILLQAQLVNSAVAVIFFYLIPYFGITPKTTLFIHLVISFSLLLIWRLYGYAFIIKRPKQNAILIGSGEEMSELLYEVNHNSRYGLNFVTAIDLDKIAGVDFKQDILNRVYGEGVGVIVLDIRNEKAAPILPHLYNLIFSKVKFIDFHRVYEDIFDRVPLSLLKYNWFLENISTAPKITYDLFKRVMDIVFGLMLGLVSLVVYPFVAVLIVFDHWGPIFSRQTRVGKNNQPITLLKFRTMEQANDGGEWRQGNVNRITRAGSFLRRARIDELPQLWNVLLGDVSLIGPRPEFPEPVKHYESELAYYNIRHLIKPGLSGWAQIYGEHPHHGTDVNKTKNKLSYDLYYIKNRSLMLDLKIALKTIKTLLSRSGAWLCNKIVLT